MVSERVLVVEEIHTYYGAIEALKGISLEVRTGEIVTLIGSNGAGKTTTLRSINGLNRPRRGRIFFEDDDVTRTPPQRADRTLASTSGSIPGAKLATTSVMPSRDSTATPFHWPWPWCTAS